MNYFPPHCNCTDWSPNLAKINAPFAFLAARNPGSYHGYNGKPLAYCPWCGSKLIELEIVDSSAARVSDDAASIGGCMKPQGEPPKPGTTAGSFVGTEQPSCSAKGELSEPTK